MPELANIFDTKNTPALKVEMDKIMSLSHIKDETTFNQTLENLLFKDKFFKELAAPVLKYLIRRFYVKLQKGIVSDADGAKRQKYLLFAVKNRFYDVFFDLSKDPVVWNNKNLEEIILYGIQESFYFDCYNKYVYDNRAASKFMFDKITAIGPTDYGYSSTLNPGGEKLSRNQLSAWISVCIYRRAPEEKYAPYLSQLPKLFIDIMEVYLVKYSQIKFNIDEKRYFHKFISDLLDKYLGEKQNLKKSLEYIRFWNDMRFGYLADG